MRGYTLPLNHALRGLEPVIIILADPEEGPGACRRFPSRYLRVMGSIGQARARGFEVPEAMLRFLAGADAAVIAIRRSLCTDPDVPATYRFPRLVEALENAHKRNLQSNLPIVRKRMHADTGGWRVRRAMRRQERRLEYALS
jgi:hypothetical protein